MAQVRPCLYFTVILLCFQIAIAKPFFGLLWCDLFCDDDDTTTTTTASTEDYCDDLLCCACEPSRPRTTTPNPATANPLTDRPPLLNFMLPPNGMNLTMSQQGPGGSWLMGFLPWGSPQGAAAPPAVTIPAAAAAAADAATTAAAAATTAAAAATTAAATTAAPGRK